MRQLTRVLMPLAVGAATVAVVVAAGLATDADRPAPVAQQQSEQQPGIVEDYSYPGAARIHTEYGVILESGDGHILFADCSTDQGTGVGLVQVRTSEGIGKNGQGLICFRVTAPTGYLTLKIPAVYEIRGDGRTSGDGHKLRAELSTDGGNRTVVEVNPNGSTPVGVGTGKDPTTLLRLEAHGEA
ncbi:hypothetical protein SAMN05421810_1193 [Amycolatopsis arida]|uniref:Uncharacterized protein n=1 Tax=Amycolatopsis arida TaxID=587909 RepID=A0A1I6B1Y1_9PSEU|nr:hypothetical protein [Amycolatopsis arida]TDX83565.1 hypothetical protein CLV69_1203 [Amycolatopsis arida]SFQ74930.1 hypothetical protein SAMN05421810_1193 [Amycolatopsis arida]